MTTTGIKTVEKLVQEVLDVVKGSKGNDAESTQELIKKVDKINTKIDKKSKDYIKELQKAFDAFQQKKLELLSENGVADSDDLKDFVAIMTNEMYDLKSQFEKFSEEFSDLSLNTTMAASQEILSMKNHVLSLNDSIDAINQYLSSIDWSNLLIIPLADSINETFKANLNTFKESIFNIIAKVLTGTDNILNKLEENSKVVEGFENALSEIKKVNQKNKDEILKIINSQIEKNTKIIAAIVNKETDSLVPKMAQLVSAISFDENEENIKESIKEEADKLISKIGQIGNSISFDESINTNLKEIIQDEFSSFTQHMAQLVGAISFDESAEDLKESISKVDSNVETAVSTSSEILNKVTNINKTVENLTKGSKDETEEYVYTLLDLESDISKVRILLDDLTKGLQNDKNITEVSARELSDKITKISSHIKDTEDVFTSPDYKAILMQFEALNDDITSISKRTNKLILTSDDSSLKLEKNIEDFQSILQRISLTVKNFDKSSIIKNISLRTDNIQKMLSVSLQSDKAINEAFIHLAGWVDETSVEVENIKSELAVLNTKIDTIVGVSKIQQQPLNDFDKLVDVIEVTNKKLDDTNKRMDAIEEKISSTDDLKSSIEFLVAQVQIANEKIAENKTLNKKIDKMEKQLQQLLACIEEDE